ncbi:hypothetical protein K438DRAFT_1998852 [Mycena galopus ATCC 62051]|nr:hypothetical protein K438DRAFT_1998852 [Mycena galopus ATCC 62051]
MQTDDDSMQSQVSQIFLSYIWPTSCGAVKLYTQFSAATWKPGTNQLDHASLMATDTYYGSQMSQDSAYHTTNYGPTFDQSQERPAEQFDQRRDLETGSDKWVLLRQHVLQQQNIFQQQLQAYFQELTSSLQKRIVELETHQAELEARQAELETRKIDEAADIAVSKDKPPKQVFALVRPILQQLLGMLDPKSDVPGPLEPGAPPRLDVNGTILHNPTWKGNADVTQPLVIAAVDMAWANELAQRTLPVKLGPLDVTMKTYIKRACIQYWHTLQTNYLAQTTVKGKEKRIRKGSTNAKYARRQRLTAERRLAIPAFKHKYGEENCAGLEAILHTPWASDGGSEPEAVDETVFRARQVATGNPDALERRRPAWRSHLGFRRTFRRALPETAKEPKVVLPINAKWAQENGYTALPNPSDFSIFDLVIADNELDAQALALLADDESA